jgi:hypothetical protein
LPKFKMPSPNDPRKQKNHGIHFVSGVSLETLQSCLLDGLDLLFDNAKTLHVTAKRCGCVGWQRNSLGGSDGIQLLARLPQYRVEITHTELDGDDKQKQETRKKAFQRAIRSVQERALVGIRTIDDVTHVWLVDETEPNRGRDEAPKPPGLVAFAGHAGITSPTCPVASHDRLTGHSGTKD